MKGKRAKAFRRVVRAVAPPGRPWRAYQPHESNRLTTTWNQTYPTLARVTAAIRGTPLRLDDKCCRWLYQRLKKEAKGNGA